jgi:valyl-tRNA synthetase
MVSSYPEPDRGLEDEDAERRMGLIVDCITRIRNIRGEMNIAPSKKLKVVVSAPDAALEGVLNEGRDYIVNLGNLEALTVGVNLAEPKGAAVGVVGAARVFVLMEGMIDIAAERARLEKEMNKVARDLSVVSRKLANRDFMDKAAEAVIKKEELKYQDLREKHHVLEAAVKKLEAL